LSGRFRRRPNPKKALATEAIQDLHHVLNESNEQSLSDASARLILRIGKKHGARMKNYSGIAICRSCKVAMVPGRNSTVRIRSKSIKYTCGICGRTKTMGPSFRGR
jgi:RNase P subunit RPR2